MRKLLSAGLVRLWRNKIFWLSCAVMAGLETFYIISAWCDGRETGLYSGLDRIYFLFSAVVGFLSALTCAFSIGPEYSDGTLRNKLISGHTRQSVYLTSLLLTALASVIICLFAIVPALALGLPLLGSFRMGTLHAAVCTVGILALSLAFSSIFTMLTMLIDSRTASSVWALVLALLFLVAGSYVYNRLDAPPTLQGYELSVNGELVETEPTPNPAYLSEGPIRKVYECLDIFLPGSQSIHYCDLNADRVGAMIACDGVLILLTTAAGLALFRRKDIK